MGNLSRSLKLISKHMYSTFKDFFLWQNCHMTVLHRVGYRIQWSAKESDSLGCKMQNFPCCCLLNVYFFFNILTVYDFMLELSKVLLNTSSKYRYTAVKMDNGISI